MSDDLWYLVDTDASMTTTGQCAHCGFDLAQHKGTPTFECVSADEMRVKCTLAANVLSEHPFVMFRIPGEADASGR